MVPIKPQWIALYTNPRAEKRVEDILRKAGYDVYLPMRRELHAWSDRKKWVEVPLLKSYIFVKMVPRQETLLRNVTGVAYIVKFKNQLTFVPEEEIQMMKDFIASEIEIQVRTTENLLRGKRVRIHSGPLAGKEGVLVDDAGDGNFAVEITGISMAMIIHVDKDLMEVIDDEEDAPAAEIKKKEYYIS